jgi:D-3-phosphoglycerate dehydrogenase
MNAKRVLLVQPIHDNGVNMLKEAGFEVMFASSPDPQKVANQIKGIDGVIVRTAPFPKQIIEKADKLQVIGRHGTGVDNIDLVEASKRAIYVVNTPYANQTSVAEHTISFILALAKRLKSIDQATRTGHFKIREEFSSIDVDGKVLGILGFGKIGSTVAGKCKAAFNMRILVHDPYLSQEKAQQAAVELTDLPTLLKESDFVSIHAPLNPETRGLIGAKELRMMKPTAFIINMARGPLWDEKALAIALRDGWIKGAATDVFVNEPPEKDNPLLGLENILLSPHMSALTAECVVRMATGAAQGVIDVLQERRPQYIANIELLKKYGKL